MSALGTPFWLLKGRTLVSIQGKVGDDEMLFVTDYGAIYRLYHNQDCCESVSLNEIVGDLNDLIGSVLIEAEEVEGTNEPSPDSSESFTWTFYKLGTAKGFVTLRWLGESNGYYSESVTFEQMGPKPKPFQINFKE